MNLSLLVQSYRLMKKAEAEERKQREFSALSAIPLNYGIIQDLINSAAYGVAIVVTLKDGTRIDINRLDPYDRAKLDSAVNRDLVGGL